MTTLLGIISGLGGLGTLIVGLLLLRQKTLTSEAQAETRTAQANTATEIAKQEVLKKDIEQLKLEKTELLKRAERSSQQHEEELRRLNRIIQDNRRRIEALRKELRSCEDIDSFRDRFEEQLKGGV